MRDAEDWTRRAVGESSNDITRLDVPPADVTTSSWAALSDYTYGEHLYSQAKWEEAIAALRGAVQKDPGFALAQGFLGDVLTNAGHQDEGARAYHQALETDMDGRLSLRERDRIKGMVAFDSFDLQAAEVAYRDYTLYYEHDASAWFRRARPLFLMGRTHDAITALEHAHQENPAKATYVMQLAGAHLVLNEQEAVDRYLDVLRTKYPAHYYLYQLSLTQVVRGSYEPAVNSMETLIHSDSAPFQWAGAAMLANLRAEQGRFDEALHVLTQRLEADPNNAFLLAARADLHCKLLQASECMQDLDHALSSDPGAFIALEAVNVLGPALSSIPSHSADHTVLRAALGRLERRRFGPEEGLRGELVRLRLRGEALLADGHPLAAIAVFRKSAALDPSIQSREYLARALETLADQAAPERRAALMEEALPSLLPWHCIQQRYGSSRKPTLPVSMQTRWKYGFALIASCPRYL